MSIALKYRPHYTLKDYEKWQGDWELVEGIPYALASPGFKHQKAVIKLISQIEPQLTEGCKTCHVAIDLDWIIAEDTVLRPDIVIFCHEPEERLTRTPEVIFEVVSESSVFMDEGLKFEVYQREGVKYYILVYPEKRATKVYALKNSNYIKLSDIRDEVFTLSIKECPFMIDFSKVWYP